MKYLLFVALIFGVIAGASQPSLASLTLVTTSHAYPQGLDVSENVASFHARDNANVVNCYNSSACSEQVQQLEHFCGNCAILAALAGPADLAKNNMPPTDLAGSVLGLLRPEILRPPRV